MDQMELDQLITTYNEYLAKLHPVAEHICEDLEATAFRELPPALPAFLEGLEWVTTAADSLVRIGKVESSGYQSLLDLIRNMGEAMDNRDYNLLRDLLDYEFLPLLAGLKANQIN